MIRDPSDGSVRTDVKQPSKTVTSGQNLSVDSNLSVTSSGLPLASEKPKDQAKLEKSREWLRGYFHGRREQGT